MTNLEPVCIENAMAPLSSVSEEAPITTLSQGHGDENGSMSYSTSQKSGKSPGMRSQLTREHENRDPGIYYNIISILGEGSMGRVAKVIKKPSVVGGSAFHDMKQLDNQSTGSDRQVLKNSDQPCFQFPFLGGLFSWCLESEEESITDLFDTATRVPVLVSSTHGSDKAETNSLSDLTNSNNSEPIMLAMKSIHLKYITSKTMVQELQNEIAILKKLDHPHIVRILEIFNWKHQIYVVMELCTGGDLYTRDPYTEEDAARICFCIVSAVSYMHAHGVIHSDLKFENILFVNSTPQAEVKLIDFGLSMEFTEHESLTKKVGTIYTMAPEVLHGDYTKQADVWSLGVIAFMLLSSRMPFYGRRMQDIMEKILKGTFAFKGRVWEKISPEAHAFVQDCLVVDPNQRLTAERAVQSTWLQDRSLGSAAAEPTPGEVAAVKAVILRYRNYPRLRKVALMVVAHHSTTDQIGILRKVFRHFDKTRSGTWNYDEFKAATFDAGFAESDYRQMFDIVNIDGTGKIRYTEFLAASMEAAGWISEDRLAEAFARVDHHEKSYISKENLLHLLGSEYPEEELDLLMKEAGCSSGKGITYADFMSQWGDDKEHFERELSKHIGFSRMVETVTVFQETDQMSVLSSEEGGSDQDDSKANFMERKALSVRKLNDFKVPLPSSK